LRIDVPKSLLLKEITILKQLLMLGIYGEFRKEMYFILSGADAKSSKENYQKMIEKVFSSYYNEEELKMENINPSVFASFGGRLSNQHFLTSEGLIVLKRISCALGFKYPQIEYSPFVLNIASHLLYFLQEDECFSVLDSLMSRSMKDEKFFKKSQKSHLLFIESLKDSIAMILPITWKSKKFQFLKRKNFLV
jgi:hypothetical protein